MTKYNKKIKNIYLMINKKKTSGKMTTAKKKITVSAVPKPERKVSKGEGDI